MKILHLTFHHSPQYDLEYVCQKLNLHLETIYFHDYAANIYKPSRYKITAQRAEAWWQDKKDYYRSFDRIVTSDTAPLSRIFLPHIDELPAELIVWICNRFDYAVEDDTQYPALLNSLAQQNKLKLIPNTEIERTYCAQRGVTVTGPTIKPLGHRPANRRMSHPQSAAFMEDADYESGFYIPMYHNETKFMNLHRHCSSLGLKTFHGIHRGPEQLKRFKAIIHIPYAWSTWSFFDTLAINVPYLVPTEKFLCELSARPGFWFQINFDQSILELAEWYRPEHRDFITYFDSFQDLVAKANNTDWTQKREIVADFAKKHHDKTINDWKTTLTQTPAGEPPKLQLASR